MITPLNPATHRTFNICGTLWRLAMSGIKYESLIVSRHNRLLMLIWFRFILKSFILP